LARHQNQDQYGRRGCDEGNQHPGPHQARLASLRGSNLARHGRIGERASDRRDPLAAVRTRGDVPKENRPVGGGDLAGCQRRHGLIVEARRRRRAVTDRVLSKERHT
jgi:hypothetical protein